MGVFDVDDIILNTIGGIIGFCIYRVIRKYYNNNVSGDRKHIEEK